MSLLERAQGVQGFVPEPTVFERQETREISDEIVTKAISLIGGATSGGYRDRSTHSVEVIHSEEGKPDVKVFLVDDFWENRETKSLKIKVAGLNEQLIVINVNGINFSILKYMNSKGRTLGLKEASKENAAEYLELVNQVIPGQSTQSQAS